MDATTETVIFEAEHPCSIEVNLIDKDTGDAIAKGGTLILQTPFIGDVVKTFTPEMKGVISTDIFGDVWPVGEGAFGDAYSLKVLAEGYLPYNMRDDSEAVWDGKFASPGERQTVTIRLTPANASIKVLDGSTEVPVTEANVQVYQHNGSCSQETVTEAVTNEDGTVSFALPECTGETSYCVRVTKEGYNIFDEHGAFQVINGKQVDYTGLVDAYMVMLEPNAVSIRVVVTNWWGNPASGELIKLGGPSYDEQTTTDIQGEALFTDLEPGSYTVYYGRWLFWINWRVIATVDAVSGEYIVRYTR